MVFILHVARCAEPRFLALELTGPHIYIHYSSSTYNNNMFLFYSSSLSLFSERLSGKAPPRVLHIYLYICTCTITNIPLYIRERTPEGKNNDTLRQYRAPRRGRPQITPILISWVGWEGGKRGHAWNAKKAD